MRIIAGTARRMELEVAEGSTTRPFLEMTRGALFNSLGEAVVGARVLDLYAGSGALGLEALSRGAERAVFVERDPGAVEALKRNIVRCGMAEKSKIVRGDVGRAAAASKETFDLIFLDPPFPELSAWRTGGGADAIMADAAKRLGPDGILVFRLEDRGTTVPDWPGLRLDSEKRHGRSRVCRYVPEAGTKGAAAGAEEEEGT